MEDLIGKKVRIIDNLEDHLEYKNQELTIKTVEENSYITVNEGNWYIGLEEVEFLDSSKKDEVERMLINLWASIGIDIPNNFEDIVQYCFEDVDETADPTNWHSGDVAIAFRRWIEGQAPELRN